MKKQKPTTNFLLLHQEHQQEKIYMCDTLVLKKLPEAMRASIKELTNHSKIVSRLLGVTLNAAYTNGRVSFGITRPSTLSMYNACVSVSLDFKRSGMSGREYAEYFKLMAKYGDLAYYERPGKPALTQFTFTNQDMITFIANKLGMEPEVLVANQKREVLAFFDKSVPGLVPALVPTLIPASVPSQSRVSTAPVPAKAPKKLNKKIKADLYSNSASSYYDKICYYVSEGYSFEELLSIKLVHNNGSLPCAQVIDAQVNLRNAIRDDTNLPFEYEVSEALYKRKLADDDDIKEVFERCAEEDLTEVASPLRAFLVRRYPGTDPADGLAMAKKLLGIAPR